MVSMRLRSVVTLTIFALLTTCKGAKVAASAYGGAAEPQSLGLDTLPSTDPQRHWPARLLGPISFLNGLAKSAKKVFSRKVSAASQEKAVTKLFNSNEVKEVNAQNFFKDQRFLKWESQVKKRFGDKSEEMILTTLYKQLKTDDNGGVEAIIAQAVKDRTTRDLGLRYEKLLLQKWVDGLNDNKADKLMRYMRYVQYRDPDQESVHAAMRPMLEHGILNTHITNFRMAFKNGAEDAPAFLRSTFNVMSGERKMADVFKNPGPGKGFNDNAFLFEKLYESSTNPKIRNEFPGFVLKQLRDSKWEDDQISTFLQQLKSQQFSSDESKKRLDPVIDGMIDMLKKPSQA